MKRALFIGVIFLALVSAACSKWDPVEVAPPDDNSVDWNKAKPGINLKAGLLMLAGDTKEKPYIIGVAPLTGFCFCNPAIYLPAEVRFGRVLTEGLYLTGNLAFGVPLGYNDGSSHSFIIEPGITLGFKF